MVMAQLTSTAASKSPEQLRVLLLVGSNEASIGSNDIDAQDLENATLVKLSVEYTKKHSYRVSSNAVLG